MTFYSLAQLAELLGVDDGKVLGWIDRGELIAINIAHRATGRPRWRVSQAALDDFLKRRQSTPSPPASTKRRKSLPAVESIV